MALTVDKLEQTNTDIQEIINQCIDATKYDAPIEDIRSHYLWIIQHIEDALHSIEWEAQPNDGNN